MVELAGGSQESLVEFRSTFAQLRRRAGCRQRWWSASGTDTSLSYCVVQRGLTRRSIFGHSSGHELSPSDACSALSITRRTCRYLRYLSFGRQRPNYGSDDHVAGSVLGFKRAACGGAGRPRSAHSASGPCAAGDPPPPPVALTSAVSSW